MRPGRTPAMWPFGRLQREGRDGIMVITVEADVRIYCFPGDTPCGDARLRWPRVDAMGGVHRAQLQHAIALVDAILGDREAIIGYPAGKPKGDGAASPGTIVARRIGRIVPSDDGRGIVCTDLEKDAPRRFNLSKIAWVRADPARDR